MRQVWIARHGGPEVLEVRETADPMPQSGQVRLRVAACGVNFADLMIRIGIYPDAPRLPAVIGYEVAGEIDLVGDGVTGLAEGTRAVALLPRYGGYSDRIVVAADEVLPIPKGLSFEQAAAIPVNYLTAWLMLIRLAHVQVGERVLIHAVAGGVGQAALQICRWRGASVIGTASASKHAQLEQLGVERCIDYRTTDFEAEVKRMTEGRGVDIVLDGVGGKSLAKSYRCLGPLGRLFVFGVSSMVPRSRRNLLAIVQEWWKMPRIQPLQLLNDNKGVFGVSMGHLGSKGNLVVPMLKEILHLVDTGILCPVVDRSFPFECAADSHAFIHARRNFGKVLLLP